MTDCSKHYYHGAKPCPQCEVDSPIDHGKESLAQIFRNNSNCYADTLDNREFPAMDEVKFVEVVSEILEGRA